MFIIAYVTNYREGVENMKIFSIRINASAFCLTNPQVASDYFLKRLYYDPNLVKTRIKSLSEMGINFKADK